MLSLISLQCFKLLDVAKQLKVLEKLLHAYEQYNYTNFVVSA